jgi:MoaA/NifB/PqqE/SkfB family radical SAM enzyme
VSTTGDLTTASFLETFGPFIDLISLPLDGSTEVVSARTKKPGHFSAVMEALDLLESHPGIDVKVATPVTRHNIDDVPEIALLLDERAERLPGRLFYNIFQAFPRSMDEGVAWDEMMVDNASFAALRRRVDATPRDYRINWLSHETLDKLYVMVFPDGSLTVPSGSQFCNFGPFLEVDNLNTILDESDFDEPKHQRHAQGWSRS